MLQEPAHYFSFILFASGGFAVIVGILMAAHAVTIPLIRHKFQAARPFLLMILVGFLVAFIGGRGLTSIPTPKRLEIEAPADSVIRAEVIRNGQIILKEEI